MKNSASKKGLTIECFAFIILGLGLLSLAACSNSTSSVMQSYDSKFPVKSDGDDDTYKPGIGEVGFDASQMLDDEYFKSSDGTLQLRGPRNGAFYKWELWLQTRVWKDGFEVEPELTLVTLPSVCFQNGSSDSTEYYIVYIPFSGLDPGSYVISLTATSKGGTKYTDSAALIIYDAVRLSN